MGDIQRQLVPLLIGSVPTMLLFLFLVISYRLLLHGPLLKVLAERRARTGGAMEKANAAIAAADAKAAEYEARLRSARAEIFRAREARIKTWTEERETALTSAREASRNRIQEKRAALDAQVNESRRDIESRIDDLASEVLKAVLPPSLTSGAVAEGPR